MLTIDTGHNEEHPLLQISKISYGIFSYSLWEQNWEVWPDTILLQLGS